MVNKEWKESLDKRKMKFNFDDPASELEAIRVHRAVLQSSKRTRRSKLDNYRLELRKLREAGATLAELLEFLKLQGVECSYSTVQRWMKKDE
ncbi:hypothetical protein AB4347_02005 [Vibrio breoganii]|uniref:hypothetical protein n=1 Tax=Vibrio breoganii TaxID=553239 RepID=UPI0010556759|nr:hypothetical protein [Vibrio breoganii]